MRRFRRSIRYVNAMFPPGILAPVVGFAGGC